MTITALPAAVRTRPAAVCDLLQRDVRDQWLVAYWPGLDDVAVHEHVVLASPDRVWWLPVVAATVAGGGIAYTLVCPDGTQLVRRDMTDWPIVLGQATS